MQLRNLILIILISVVALIPLTSSAQDATFSIEKLTDVGENRDFVVGPGKTELELNPGESRIVNLKISNRTGRDRPFIIEIEDFTGSNDLSQTVVLLGDDHGPYSLKDYLRVPAYEFILRHGDRATVPVTISIPADAEPGGRYGSVIMSISTEGEGEMGQASTAIISRIGTLFFVKVKGEVEENGVLKEFRAKTGKKFFGKSPIEFEILYENSGNIHLNPYGEIRVKNILGKEVGNILLDPWFALPDSVRLREISWDKDPLFGFYTAEASINRGYSDIIDEDEFSFFVIPLKLTLVSLLSVLAVILLIRFLSKKIEIRRKT